ncbi:MAG TPA: hypothetical protein VHT52_21740 [Stellaceae bacterium]|jgi:hypothetical protein|nr:hypothetical protein [Stellaceae bacterium]
MASLIKGMLVRGDDQSDIAACFLVNGGRISEINTGKRMPDVEAAAPDDLPPPGPYPSPYELHKAGLLVWHTRVALQHTKDKIELALKALDAVELAP